MPGPGRASRAWRALIAGPSDLPGGQGAWRERGNDEHDRATTGQDLLMRDVELRRHTDNEGDRLTPQGAADAEMIGRDRLHPPYAPAGPLPPAIRGRDQTQPPQPRATMTGGYRH